MLDMTKLSASKIDALYVKHRDEMIAISDELIAAGLGTVSGEEIRKLADNGDPLAVRYVQVQEAFQEVAYERSARFHNQGSAKPVRSMTAVLSSAIRRLREEDQAPSSGGVGSFVQVERAASLPRRPALVVTPAGGASSGGNRK